MVSRTLYIILPSYRPTVLQFRVVQLSANDLETDRRLFGDEICHIEFLSQGCAAIDAIIIQTSIKSEEK